MKQSSHSEVYKKERGLCKTAPRIKLPASYRLLELLQAPFRFVFWFIEQRKSRLHDHIANDWNGR